MAHGYAISSLLYTRDKSSLILKGNIKKFVDLLLDSDVEQVYLEVEPFAKLPIKIWFVKDASDNEIYVHIRIVNKILHTRKKVFELDDFQELIDSVKEDQVHYLQEGEWESLSEKDKE